MRILTVLLLALAVACESTPQIAQVSRNAEGEPVGLHRYREWTPKSKVVQGAQPEGDVAFRNMKALGVTTVLSVDGAVPDVEGAAKHGLTYVHVPIGYDGVTAAQALQIARAVRDAPGRVYIHCHHGRHRGPAASMVARITLDGISNEEAVRGLESSGTSPKYTGLYRDIRNFKAPSDAQMDAAPEPQSKVVPAGVQAMMVGVSQRYEWLKKSKSAGWGVPEDSPDVSPPHEARMLWEMYRETRRLDEAKKLGEKFLRRLDEGEKAAVALENALRASNATATATAWKAVKANCNDCHTDFRN